YVGQIARQFAMQGHQIDVFTRLDSASLPIEMEWGRNVRIIHVPAGPARYLPKEELLPHMDAFSRFFSNYVSTRDEPYDIIHANFFMSAMAALPICRKTGIPLAVTFHALGRVRRHHQGKDDRFDDARFSIADRIVQHADRIIAECPQARRDLIELYGADPDKIRMVPGGYDPREMSPMDTNSARSALGWDPDAFYVLQLGR